MQAAGRRLCRLQPVPLPALAARLCLPSADTPECSAGSLYKHLVSQSSYVARRFEDKLQEVVRVLSPGPLGRGKPGRYWDSKHRQEAQQAIRETLRRSKEKGGWQ